MPSLLPVQRGGPLTPRQIREEVGLLNKQIMPALHRLQTAWLVYEDQVDDGWDRAWYGFETEWPDVEISEERRSGLVSEVLLRFIDAHVFATFENVRDWSRLPARRVGSCLGDLDGRGEIVRRAVPGLGEGFCLTRDVELPEMHSPPTLFVLPKGTTFIFK